MTDLTSRRLDFVNYLPRHISDACSLVDRFSISSVGHTFILFTSLKFKKVFMIHGFKFRYIILGEKFPSCIKEPQHKENTLVSVGSRVSQHEKASFDLPGISPCFDFFNKQQHY